MHAAAGTPALARYTASAASASSRAPTSSILARSLATATASVKAAPAAPVAKPDAEYRVVVVGAGTGGLSTATALAENLRGEKIAIVDPAKEHYNQPLWTFVGGGLKPYSDSVAPLSSLIPRGVKWENSAVTKIDPVAKLVHTSGGRTLGYDYLVLAPGIVSKWDAVKGLEAALADPASRVVSNYHKDHVKKTAPAFKSLDRGRAVFTMPSTPVKCAGAPQKIVYIAEEYWRESGRRDAVDVAFYTGTPKIFAIDKYAAALTDVCTRRNIHTHFLHNLAAVDTTRNVATFQRVASPVPGSPPPPADPVEVPFDFLHVTPPMGPPPFIAESGLGDAAGFVNVDRHTLQHVVFPSVFSLGDASSVPTSKTAAAVAAESPVLVKNLLAHMSGRPPPASYDGYTSCPLVTGRKSLILAEFSGFTGQPMETFPVDQAVESLALYKLTADVLPPVYWRGLVSGGWWKGPAPVRAALNKVFGHASSA
ncbi:hypothetical protein H9P43_008331 [Blastocladiella emersonii ATCC 22665]|nr:hypothetical protein H9P43_008331 [Blastocladiella emersonii ATCC 22665]